jgi:hypothetical protein
MGKKKDKMTNNYLQNTTHKTKDCATRIPLKERGGIRCSVIGSNSCSTVNLILILLNILVLMAMVA